MKILGRLAKLKPRYVPVTVGEDEEGKPVVLKLYSISLTEAEEWEREFEFPDEPDPPMDASAGAIKRPDGSLALDASGAPLVARNPNAPSYLAAMDLWAIEVSRLGKAKAIGLIVRSLKDQLELDTKRESYGTASEFAYAAREEMEAGGFDMGILNALGAAARSGLALTQREVTETAQEVLGADPN